MSESKRTPLVRHNLHAPYLFKTANGRILHCACCGRVQVEFGDALFLMTTDTFGDLCDTVRETLEDAPPSGTWQLRVDGDAARHTVSLNRNQLRALDALLDGAYAMYVLRKQVRAVARGTNRDVALHASRHEG